MACGVEGLPGFSRFLMISRCIRESRPPRTPSRQLRPNNSRVGAAILSQKAKVQIHLRGAGVGDNLAGEEDLAAAAVVCGPVGVRLASAPLEQEDQTIHWPAKQLHLPFKQLGSICRLRRGLLNVSPP